MKDAMNYFIPIVEDPMNVISGRCITIPHHVSSNGYYGYQPVPVANAKESNAHNNGFEQMDIETNHMDGIQFNNLIEPDIEDVKNLDVRGNINRKRTWEYCTETGDYKKRRENEPLLEIPEQSNNKCSQVRQPTHNIPDLPRCMMDKKPTKPPENRINLLEEMLEQTHGVSPYHWLGHDL